MLECVFDCNVLLQAMARPHGPAGACFAAVMDHRACLFVSDYVLSEFQRTTAHPKVRTKLGLSDTRITLFTALLHQWSIVMPYVPPVVDFLRDRKDAPYIDLAIASKALLIVTRDHDLLDLMLPSNIEGQSLRNLYPTFSVISPVQMLEKLKPAPESP